MGAGTRQDEHKEALLRVGCQQPRVRVPLLPKNSLSIPKGNSAKDSSFFEVEWDGPLLSLFVRKAHYGVTGH